MEKPNLIKYYKVLEGNARTTLDLYCFSRRATPWILSNSQFVCSDGTKVSLLLVIDSIPSSTDICGSLRVIKDDKFFDYHLLSELNENFDSLIKRLLSEEAETRAIQMLSDLWTGGNELIEERISQVGITWCDTLVLTNKRMDSVMKLSSSCTLAVHGELFHGADDFNSYCQNQTENSSPYILKRSFIAECDDCFVGNDGQCRCINYLVCRNKAEANSYARYFLDWNDVSACSMAYQDKITPPYNFPAVICTAEGLEYYLLVYVQGYSS